MDVLHMSILGKTEYKALNDNWIHLAHMGFTDYHLMAFVDGFGKESLRNSDEMCQVNPAPENESDISATEVSPETYLLCKSTQGYRAGTLSSRQLAQLYANAKDFFYPRYSESEAESMRIENLFQKTCLPVKLYDKTGKAVLNGFADIQAVYWYSKEA